MKVRALTSADADAWFTIRRESFDAKEDSRHQEVYFGDGSSYFGVELDGGLVGVTEVVPVGQYFGGRSVACGVVVTVAVRPGARGRGVGAALMQATLDRCREWNLALGVLHPATTSFYRRFGWEITADYGIHRVEAAALLAFEADPAATLTDAGREAAPDLRECYERGAVGRDGWIDRSDEWWKRRPLGFGEFVVILRRQGRVDGYCSYDHVADVGPWGDEWGIIVREVVAVDAAAAHTLWRALGTHSSQTDTVRISGPLPDDLVFGLAEQVVQPVGINRVLGRIIDGPAAIAARGYSSDVDAEVHVALTDAHLSVNNDAFVLRVADGVGTLEPGGRGEVHLDVGTLATLYSGYRSATDLAIAGRVAGPDAARRSLDVIFAGPRPGMWDDF
jgi:predicted acetyltransferase